MKSRSGFVSNSSTSSFIILFKNDEYTKQFEKADEYTKAVMKVVVGEPKPDSEVADVFGIPYRIAEFSDGNYDSFAEYYSYDIDFSEEIPEEYSDYYGCESRDAFEKFKEKFAEGTVEEFSVET